MDTVFLTSDFENPMNFPFKNRVSGVMEISIVYVFGCADNDSWVGETAAPQDQSV